MKKYNVKVPFCGAVFVEIEARSQDEACEKALENGDALNAAFDARDFEFEYLEHVSEGHVFYGPYNDIEAEEASDD